MLHKPSKSNILKKIHLLPHYPSNNKRSSSNKLSDEAIQQLGTLTGKRMTNMTVDTQMQLMNEMYAASHNLIGQRKESAMKLTQREEQAGPIFRNKMLQKVQQEQVQQQQVDDYFTQNSRETSEVNQVRRRLQDIKRRYFSNSQQREEDMDRVGTVERIKRKLTSLQNAPKLQPSSQYFNQTQLDDYGSRKIVGYADGDSYPTIQAQVAHKNSSVALMNQNESQLSFMPPPPVYAKQDSIPTTYRHFHNKQAVLKLNSQLIDTPLFAQKGDKPFILQPIKDDIKILKSSLAGPSSIMSGGSSLERLNPQPSIFSGRESLRDINKSTMLGSYPSQMNSKAYLKSERIMEPTQLFRPVQFVNSNVRPLDHPLKNIQRMVDRQKAQTTLKKDFQAISSLSIQKQSKILTIVPSQSPINIDESGKKKFTMPKLQLLSPNAVNTFTSPIGSVNSTPQAALQPTLNYFQKRGLANMSTGLDDTITPPILLVKQHVIHHAGTKQNSPKKVSSPFAKHIRSQSQALGSNDINYLQQQTSLDGETMMQQMIQHVDSLTEYPNNTVRSNHIAQSITHVDVAIKNKGGYN
ncbi:hypothetical protein FGO68_gene11107 [Halteria grandinella]|uniref:Uncharacterized protein n=1 Tax=Halteria grandinella TaxID=5974 RepID=A0A8J8NYM5_HALGN|nr:hypothetical protein FGO68_gene11107 [Halteria grandinella]